MNVRKEIKIDFSENEIRAIEIIAKMTDEFSALCGDNIESVYSNIEKFLNNEDWR